MTNVAERIRNLRGNFSREEFASSIGIKPTTLRNYELSVSLPHADVLASICINLHINPAWLLLGEGSPRTAESKSEAEPDAVRTLRECSSCTRMARHIASLEEERKTLLEEVRQFYGDNRKLWQEHGELLKNLAVAREECATLRERLTWVERAERPGKPERLEAADISVHMSRALCAETTQD